MDSGTVESPMPPLRTRWLEPFVADVKYAIRYFGRNKLTASLIVTVLALGIGANIFIFSMLQALFFRPPLGVPMDASQVRIHGLQRATRAAQWQPAEFSVQEMSQLAARTETFRDIVGWVEHDVVLDAGDSTGARGVGAQFVTPNYFAFLNVPLAAGPGFARTDEVDDAAVMSFQTAQMLYGDPTVAVGRRILVNDRSMRVVGIAPPGFQGAIRDMGDPALWIPMSARTGVARVAPGWVETPALTLVGRLAPDVKVERAESDVQQVIVRTLPDSAERVGMARRADVFPMHDLPSGSDSREMAFVSMMIGSVGLLILLVACTNVSSLMVAAAVARRHEITVRMSLGASRARVLRQLLSETTLLAVGGAVIGLLVSWWLLTWVQRSQSEGVNVMPDAGTISFALAVALGTGMLFGLSPALHAMRGGLSSALRDSGGAGSTSRSHLQRVFVVAQIVFSQPLLLLLGMMLFLAIADYKPLPDDLSQRLVAVGFRPLSKTGGPGQRREAVDSLIPRIATHPEVVGVVPEAAAFEIQHPFRATNRTPGDTAQVRLDLEGAAPGYFSLIDVPILLGRDVTLADTSSRDVPIVVGSNLARAVWGDASPLGQTLKSLDVVSDSLTLVVVGVYDATRSTTRGDAAMRVYTARGKHWRRDAILVRTRGVAEPFLPELRRLMRAEAPGLPVTRVTTRAMIDRQERWVTIQVAGLAGAGGVVALMLASLGLYGVIALAVQQRRREIGIRIAVGARPAQVSRMFLGAGVRLGATALLIGLPISVVVMHLAIREDMLLVTGVNPTAVGLGIAVVLLAVASGAAWIPARRAARVDPATTLRIE